MGSVSVHAPFCLLDYFFGFISPRQGRPQDARTPAEKTRFHGTKCLLGVAKPQFNIFDFDAPM